MTERTDELSKRYDEGRRVGLAIAAIAVAAVAFLSLLGVEKAILALILAVLAFRGAASNSPGRKLAIAAIGIVILYVITVVIVLLVYHEKLAELIRLIQHLS